MNGNIKLGKLLCEEDIITKRQLNKALQLQVKGDKRAIGEILVDLNFCTLDEITEVLLNQEEINEDLIIVLSAQMLLKIKRVANIDCPTI